MKKNLDSICAICGHTFGKHAFIDDSCPTYNSKGTFTYPKEPSKFHLLQQEEKPEGVEAAEQAKPKDAVTEAVEFFNKISENIILESGCIAVIGSIFVYIYDSKYDLNRHTLEDLPAYMRQLPNKQFIAVFN